MAEHASNILCIMYIASNKIIWYYTYRGDDMAYSKSSNKAVQQYIKKTYDQVSLRMPKGQREKIQSFAELRGKSLNMYIMELIEEDMKRSGYSLE